MSRNMSKADVELLAKSGDLDVTAVRFIVRAAERRLAEQYEMRPRMERR